MTDLLIILTERREEGGPARRLTSLVLLLSAEKGRGWMYTSYYMYVPPDQPTL